MQRTALIAAILLVSAPIFAQTMSDAYPRGFWKDYGCNWFSGR